jgi:hypothetical protein
MPKVKEAQILLDLIRFFSYLIVFTPFVVSARFFFPFVGPKSLYFMGLAEIIFFCWLILVFIDRNYRPKFNFLLFALIFYLLVFILSSIFGVDFSYSFWSKHERMTGILMHLHLFLFFLVLGSVFKKEDFKRIFVVSILVAIFLGAFAVFNVKDIKMRGGGTIGNESFLGTYLLFDIFFALYLFFDSLDWKKKFGIFSFVLLFFFLLAIGVNFEGLNFKDKILALIFKAGARAAKISFYGAIFLLFLLWLISQKRKFFKILGFFILIPSFILISFALYSIMFQSSSFFRRLAEKEVGSFGGRFYVWEIAKKAFFERPLLGFGPENFEFAFSKYYNPCFGTPECGGDFWYDRAHNVIFDTLSTTGILGLISYFLLFLSFFFVLWKSYWNKKINFWTAGVFTALFLAYFVQNLTVFDMVSSYLMLFLSLAFVSSFEKREKEKRELKSPPKILVVLFFILFSLSFFYFIFRPLKSSWLVIKTQPREELVSHLEKDVERKDDVILVKVASFKDQTIVRKYLIPQSRIELYEKSLRASPLGKYQIRDFFAKTTLEFLFSPAVSVVSLEEIKKELDFVIGELEKTTKENPLDLRSYLKLGELYNFYSQIDPEKIKKGEEVLNKALSLSPKNQQVFWHLAQNMIFQNKIDIAIDLAKKAIDLEPNLKESHLIFIRILKVLKKEDLLKSAKEKALSLHPEWEKEIEEEILNP